jgi:hypothetical protein
LKTICTKGTAVETGFGVGAAEAVVDADQFETLEDQILGAGAVTFEQRRFVGKRRHFTRVDRTEA